MEEGGTDFVDRGKRKLNKSEERRKGDGKRLEQKTKGKKKKEIGCRKL